MSKASIISLLPAIAVAVLACQGCGEILGPSFPVITSPRVIITTPSSPASGIITLNFQLIDREKEPGDVTIEYSTDGTQTFQGATLTATSQATGLVSEWHPGITHSVQWDSVTDMVGISGDAQICVRVTPSDASNPSGTADITGTFTVDNIAFNQAPTATVATPAGVQSGNIQLTYTLTDTEGDTCSIIVEFSIDGGAYQTATMGPAGDGTTGLPSSPGGTSHTFLWDSRTDNVGPLTQQDNVRIRITPEDFHTGTAVATSPFSVDNSVPNNPPTVSITSGPANGSTIYTDSVTFVWSGSDTDGSISGYYYSFDKNPPDIWTTGTSVTSGILTEGSHTFRVVAMDNDGDFSTVVSRTFTVSTVGTIEANFSASPLSGTAPLAVSFTDTSTSTSGITLWSWNFGDGGGSTSQNPSYTYSGTGTYTVTLTVAGPDGSDTETKASYITVTSPGGNTIYVNDTSGSDTNSGLSWAQAVKTIQTGLDKASASGWTVLVANGTYTGANNKNLDFDGKAIHLKSVSGAENCVIDCEDAGRGFYFGGAETNDSIVDGFTVRNGRVESTEGGAIWCRSSSSPTITNCTLVNNYAESYGGAIQCNSSSPLISNCIITSNIGRGGGGINCISSAAVIVDCIIENNTATSSFASRGGGINIEHWSNPTITNCRITNNSASSTFFASKGGGICCDYNYCNPTITNCIIANNTAAGYSTGHGGGVFCAGTVTPTFYNTILWGNTCTDGGHQIYSASEDSTTTLEYCNYANSAGDVEGTGTVTPGNCINLDPLFVNATAQDYHLQDTSPCIDAGGNSYVTGITTDLDGNPRIANATVDIGAYEYQTSPSSFARTWGGASDDGISSLAVDSGGNIYCAGYAESFGAGGYDALLLKYDGAGTLQWVRTWGGAATDFINSLAVDSGGNIYCAGYTRSFGAGGYDALLLKYDSTGTLQWARTWGGAGSDSISSLAVDSGGNIYCAGYTYSFGAGLSDTLLLRYDSAGTLQWARTWGGADYDYIISLAVDSGGNIYCAGSTESFGAGSRDALLLRYDGAGTLQWARTWGGAFNEWTNSLAVDSGGNIYCAGITSSFGAGDYDALLLRYDNAGTLQWARTWGGAGDDWIFSLAVDSGGNIYCAGYTYSFGAGGRDALLLRYDSASTLQWARTWGGVSDDRISSLAVDSGGDFHLGGYTESYTGAWQVITTGTESSPSGTQSTPSGSQGSPTGTQASPTGTQGSPTGSETGAGGEDALLLKNWE